MHDGKHDTRALASSSEQPCSARVRVLPSLVRFIGFLDMRFERREPFAVADSAHKQQGVSADHVPLTPDRYLALAEPGLVKLHESMHRARFRKW